MAPRPQRAPSAPRPGLRDRLQRRGARAARALCLAAAGAAISAPVAAAPLNIVLIVADNQAATALRAYGNHDVDTPHIDALAADGVRFTAAYAASGMCSPTRATLLTGLLPSRHGLHNALSDPWVEEQPPGWNAIAEFRTAPLTLARRGYQTAMIGKWHLGDARQPSLGFQHWVALPYGHTRSFWDNELVVDGGRVAVDDRHIVDAMADHAVAYLRQVDRARPFYLQLNLDGPYALPPSNAGPARNRHYARYAAREFHSMPAEPVADAILSRLAGPYVPGQDLFELRSLDAVWDHLYYGTIRMQGDRESYANFLSQNSMVDDAVGRVRRALRERGLADRTVVVYTADQGNLFGQHGTWGHSIWFQPSRPYDETVRVPLIAVHPGAPGGRTSDRLVAQYDFAATLLDLAGVGDVAFDGSPGRSFAATLRGADEPPDAHEAVYFEQEETRGLRTDQHVYWKPLPDLGDPMLFDVRADPEQREDLYPALAGSPRVAALDAKLDAFFAEHADPRWDLWNGGVSKGTPPRPFLWLRRHPWAWLQKYLRDHVLPEVPTTPFDEPGSGA